MTSIDPGNSSFFNYLLAKRAIDEDSLHPRLWHAFLYYIDDRARNRSRGQPMHLLELGCGIGTMFERLYPKLSTPTLLYSAIDSEAANLIEAASRLTAFTVGLGFAPAEEKTTNQSHVAESIEKSKNVELCFEHGDGRTLRICLYCLDVQTNFPADLTNGSLPVVDGVIAHAFMDLVQCRPLLERLRPMLSPGANLYLTINFDRLTLFEPILDPELDQQIEDLYHATMDSRIHEGISAGHSRTGRRLFHDLRATGFTVLDMAGSDWVVFPQTDGYANAGAEFLYHIINFVEGALKTHPELDQDRFQHWLQQRRSQIQHRELLYIAHQLDYLVAHHPA